MNRVIKFRAWDGAKMHTSVPVKNLPNHPYKGLLFPINDVFAVAPTDFVWMQFTGLLDKNGTGKEIYEGDVVNFYDPNYPAHFSGGKVVFNDACFWVEYEGRWTPMHELEQFEVTSNIYEN